MNFYAVPFIYQSDDSSGRSMTFAYLHASSADSAEGRVKKAVALRGNRYIGLADKITTIDLCSWDQRRLREWPEYLHLLPSQGELRASENIETIFFLPRISLK